MFCSDECREVKRKERALEAYHARYTYESASIQCHECLTVFVVEQRASQIIYCSDECGTRSFKRNSKARTKLQVPRSTSEVIYFSVVWQRDGGVCQLCHEPIDLNLAANDLWSATLDHIVPYEKNGTHTYDNIQLAHRQCNAIKGDR